MRINSVDISFTAISNQKILKKSANLLSKNEHETLLDLKNVYENLENLYKSDEYKEKFVQRDVFLRTIDNYIREKEDNIADTFFTI